MPDVLARRAKNAGVLSGSAIQRLLEEACEVGQRAKVPRCRTHKRDPKDERAKARGIEVARLVNELLKKDIELIEAVRSQQTVRSSARPR